LITPQFVVACLGAGTVLLVPGYAAASLIVPRWSWWERLAMAPGLATGFIGVLGLLLHDIRMPFTGTTVLPPMILLVVAGAASIYRRRDQGGQHPRELVAPLVALAAGSVTILIFLAGVAREPLPIYDDPAVHAAVAEAIHRTHDVLPAIPQPVNQSAAVRPRTAVEATAVVAGWVVGRPPAQLLLPIGLVAAVLISLGLLQLARAWLVPGEGATLAPLLGMGMALPVWPLIFGEYPLLVDATMVSGLICGILALMRGEDTSRAAVLVAALTASIWAGHGLEALTAAAVGGLLVARELAAPARSRTRAALGLVAAAGAVLSAALLVTVLTRAPHVPTGIVLPVSPTTLRGLILSPHPFPGGPLGLVLQTIPSRSAVVLCLVGCFLAIRRYRLVSLVLLHVALVAMLYDVSTHLYLKQVWSRMFPWAVPDRVRGMAYWVVPILLALGASWLFRQARQLRASRGQRRRRLLGSVLLATTLGLLIGGGLSALSFEWSEVYDQSIRYGKTTSADVEVLAAMRARLPRGAIVMTDGEDDAGIWVDALTPQIAFMTKDWVNDHPDDWHLVALQRACDDPNEAHRALAEVDAVFVGSRHNVDAQHPWKIDCIRRIPDLRSVAESTTDGRTAALFIVGGARRTPAP
jgi:hypothetical protein